MTDQKPKHKPQKKRTLEEVLKSLQDLIRNDLVSAQPQHSSWRESGQAKNGSQATAAEADSFHQALFKLDQIINEKIVEPVEHARETPPEPLLPDEELEIEWDAAAEPAPDGDADIGDIEAAEAAEAADWDTESAQLEEIELQPLAPDTAPSAELPVEPAPDATPEPKTESEPLAAVPEQIPPEPITAVIETAPAAPAEEPAGEPPAAETEVSFDISQIETIDLSAVQEPIEPTDGQREFEFATPREERNPAPAPPLESATSTAAVPEAVEEYGVAEGAKATENAETASPEDSMTVDLSAPGEAESSNPTAAPEQPEAPAVEAKSGANTDAFTVEFTVEPKPRAPAGATAPDIETEVADSARASTASAEAASQPPDESAVKKRSTPSDSTEPDKPPSEGGPAADETPSTEPSIPVLKDVADLKAPPAPPLPEVSQARDIAIRVIARLNIERRKSGEKPLDIKTIERLQQYLADALNKRALNKPK
jgi:hypothetical protein